LTRIFVHEKILTVQENRMYTTGNFRSKKQLKTAVDARRILIDACLYLSKTDIPATLERCEAQQILRRLAPPVVTYFQPGGFGGHEPMDGEVFCEGPHYPEPHKWYAACTAKGGVIVGVK
jgi:hypothetical protein